MPSFSPTRAAAVMLLIAGCLIGMIGRVGYLQTIGRERTLNAAVRQQGQKSGVLARRGTIFDASGNALAVTVQAMNVYVDPQFMRMAYERDGRNPSQIPGDVAKLAAALEMDPSKLAAQLREKADARYLKLADDVSEAACGEIRKLNIPGVGLEPFGKRYYPMGPLAAHVLGTVRRDGIGLEGLELKYQGELAGRNGYKRTEKDARRRPIGIAADDYIPPQHGQHLVLTLDANIQMIAEQELSEACREHRAPRGEAIVLDPYSGDVLALANWPGFNPQNLEDSTPQQRRNRALTDPYEPGSTLKPFVMGPAIAWQVTRPTEMWPIPGISYITPYGRRISDVHGYGQLSSWDVLVKSSNIGMCMLAERMKNPKLYRALTSFGFGRPTGIDLPGEGYGLVYALSKWRRDTTESIAQGYEMMVTPIQIARAFCVYANGGHLVIPRVVKGRLDAEGNIVARSSSLRLDATPRVLDEETVSQMRQIMADVVVRGTGTAARSKHWNLFGKTGTAHISKGKGYLHDKINASFLCGAPLENPRIVVAVILHEHDRSTGRYGGSVSAPTAMRIVERTLAYLQVPESPALAPPPPSIASILYNFDARKYAAPPSAHALAE